MEQLNSPDDIMSGDNSQPTSGGISTHERLKRYSPAKLKNNSLFEDNANNMGFKSYNIGFAKKYKNAGVQSIFIKSMKKMCGPSG